MTALAERMAAGQVGPEAHGGPACPACGRRALHTAGAWLCPSCLDRVPDRTCPICAARNRAPRSVTDGDGSGPA